MYKKHVPNGWYSIGFMQAQFYFCENDLRYLGIYNRRIGASINEIDKEYGVKIKDDIKSKKLGDDEIENIDLSRLDKLNMLGQFFPKALRYTTLSYACTTFESRMSDICELLDSNGTIVKLEKINHKEKNILKRTDNYFGNNFGFKISKIDGWEVLADIFKIRHCIIHASGKIDKMKNPSAHEIRRIINKYKNEGLSENELGEVSLSDRFIQRIIKEMKIYLREMKTIFKGNRQIGPVYWP